MTDIVRYAKPSEQEKVEELSREHPYTKDFKYLWRRWGNWNKARTQPIVVERDGEIIGFSAVSFGKKYVNSYYRFVSMKHRGGHLNTVMLNFILAEAKKYGIPRYKFKMPTDVASLPFWRKRGLLPFGIKDNQYLFDFELNGVETSSDLRYHPMPDDILRKYRANGVKLLTFSELSDIALEGKEDAK